MKCGSCKCFEPERPDQQVSRACDRQLREDDAIAQQQIKLLLLGPGESGKSTIFKQMKVLHMNGYTTDELQARKIDVHCNIIHNSRIVLHRATELGLLTDDIKEIANRILQLDIATPLTSELGAVIKELWNSQAIQNTLNSSRTFTLPDSALYFVNNIERICQEEYMPDVPDVLRTRVRTVGVAEQQWTIDNTTFRLFDVGGQRSERRKWLHLFDSVTAVIFVASLSDFDQMLEESSGMNRMLESLTLFDQVCNSGHFENTSIILFLNKIDLFNQKLKAKRYLADYLPDYTGDNSYDDAISFIQQKFLGLNRYPDTRRIYVHHTCATNTSNVKIVFDSVKNVIISAVLE